MRPGARSSWHKFYVLACVIIVAAWLEGCSAQYVFDHSDPNDAATATEPTFEARPGTEGEVLIVGGATSSKTSSGAAELFNPKTEAFETTGALKATRAGIRAVDFSSGPLAHRALVANGLSGSGTISASGALSFKVSVPRTSEIFTESAGSFQALAAKTDGSFFYTMTLLHDGSVLIVGGYTDSGAVSKSGYVFDPATKNFKLTGSLNAARALHTATLLQDGTVLIVGGITDSLGDTIGTAELYHPNTNKFTQLAQALPGGLTLAGHTATLITGCKCSDDGKVLIAGGFSGVAFEGRSLESSLQHLFLYDPTVKTFTSMGILVEDRMFHSASLLPDGKVLLAGGIYGQAFVGAAKVTGLYGGVRASAEIFNSTFNTTTCVGGLEDGQCADSMGDSRGGHSATTLANGDILLAGGEGALGTTTGGKGNALATAELFIPSSGKFKAVGNMHSTHAFHAAVLLQ